MDLQLAGKRALITGGSKGIGRATAEVLAEEGMDLLLVSRSAEMLEETANAIRRTRQVQVETLAADLSQESEVLRLAQHAGEIDVLVNNAGAIPPGTVLSVDNETWRKAWDLKVFGFISLCRQLYPHMAARKSGVLKPTDINGSIAGFLGKGGESGNHIPGADSSTSETHTATNLLGREALLRVLRFLKEEPAFALMTIERLQPEAGIRETFRIIGETTITQEDYTSGRVFEDAVAHSFYPIDLHYEGGVTPKHLNEGIVPTIPLRALIPKASKNLLVAGRCLSSDQLANSALRVQASCMAMGQAAGVTAALAAKAGTTPSQVPLADIRRELTRHGAIVPPRV